MSEEIINLGADWEQSRRLVNHWHQRWTKSEADLQEARDLLQAQALIAEKDISRLKEAEEVILEVAMPAYRDTDFESLHSTLQARAKAYLQKHGRGEDE